MYERLGGEDIWRIESSQIVRTGWVSQTHTGKRFALVGASNFAW